MEFGHAISSHAEPSLQETATRGGGTGGRWDRTVTRSLAESAKPKVEIPTKSLSEMWA